MLYENFIPQLRKSLTIRESEVWALQKELHNNKNENNNFLNDMEMFFLLNHAGIVINNTKQMLVFIDN